MPDEVSKAFWFLASKGFGRSMEDTVEKCVQLLQNILKEPTGLQAVAVAFFLVKHPEMETGRVAEILAEKRGNSRTMADVYKLYKKRVMKNPQAVQNLIEYLNAKYGVRVESAREAFQKLEEEKE